MSKTSTLNFRVDPEEYAHLQDMAREKNYGVAEMARACLREGLQKAHTFEPKPADIAVRPRRVPGARQGPGVLAGATPLTTAWDAGTRPKRARRRTMLLVLTLLLAMLCGTVGPFLVGAVVGARLAQSTARGAE